VNNFLRLLSLSEQDMHRFVVVSGQKEGGINSIYDPELACESFQIFIHNRLPFRTVFSQDFPTFPEARAAAAQVFGKGDWEMLTWDFKTNRPCEEGGKECGSGECDTCKSIKAEGGAAGCSTEKGAGSCGCA